MAEDPTTPETPASPPEVESPKTLIPPTDQSLVVDPPSKWDRFRVWVGDHRTRVIIAIGILLLIPAAAFAWYSQQQKPVDTKVTVVTKKVPPKPTTVPAPLTGLPVTPEVAARPITAVVIENQTDARPQSGLSQAGVVYEALAEGGITRFLAFFQDERPKEMGPVRSIRTYFVDWALEFNAPVAHAGGNADALDLIQPLKMKDMNQFSYGDYFYRANDRYAPHNLYITSDKLDAMVAKLGYNQAPKFTVSPRKKDAPENPPTHPNIAIDYSYNGYQVDYKYNAGCNCYDRFLAGQPHIDRNTGKQIQVKNVVVEYMPTNYGTTRIGESTVMMGTPGSGEAIVFRDGGAVTGTWTKAEHTSRTVLKDATGSEIALDAGNTWYSIVPIGKVVGY